MTVIIFYVIHLYLHVLKTVQKHFLQVPVCRKIAITPLKPTRHFWLHYFALLSKRNRPTSLLRESKSFESGCVDSFWCVVWQHALCWL